MGAGGHSLWQAAAVRAWYATHLLPRVCDRELSRQPVVLQCHLVVGLEWIGPHFERVVVLA